MSKPFMEYDLADFSNTNKEQKSLAEIRRDAYTDGFMNGKNEGLTEAYDESITILKGLDTQIADIFENIIKNAKHYCDN